MVALSYRWLGTLICGYERKTTPIILILTLIRTCRRQCGTRLLDVLLGVPGKILTTPQGRFDPMMSHPPHPIVSVERLNWQSHRVLSTDVPLGYLIGGGRPFERPLASIANVIDWVPP